MVTAVSKKETVSIQKSEYLRLKKLDARFRDLFAYFENLSDVREARKEVKEKKLLPQEKLFQKLGL